MATIFGNSMATGRFAKDSSSALGTEDTENDGEGEVNAAPNTSEDNGASSSATRPNKRAKLAESEDVEGLVGALKSSSERLAVAIEMCARGNNDLPPDLLQMVQELPGFDVTHKSFYYAHLIENPHVGRAFYNALFEYKLTFIAKWISEKFPG